jgi:CheY-like chemotaxis protein
MHILLVDDDIAFDKLTATIDGLSDLGHFVKPVSTGEEALRYIQEKHLIIDLILMDELLATTGSYQSGALLGKEIWNDHPHISLVLFTATGTNYVKAVQAWMECNFSAIVDKDLFVQDIPFYLKKILDGENVIKNIAEKKKICDGIMVRHLLNLNVPERKELANQLTSGQLDILKSHLIWVEGHRYSLGEILGAAIFYDTSQSASYYIIQYLKRTRRDHIFQGDWILPVIETHLAYYYALSIPEFSNTNKEIDMKAFDLMLNILHIQKMMNEDDSTDKPFKLNVRNHKISATDDCSHELKGYDRFKDKLICRRIALAFTEFNILNEGPYFKKIHMAALLRHGNTTVLKNVKNSKKTEASFKPSTVFSTHLGLTTNQSDKDNFETGDNYVLFEERRWLNTYGQHAVRMADFLQNFTLGKGKLAEGITYSPPDNFVDLTEFKTYFAELKLKISPEIEQKVKEHVYLNANQLPQFLTELIVN